MTTETALTVIDSTTAPALFVAGGCEPIIESIRAEIEKHVADISTAKGRDAIKSLAHKVAKSKTALDNAGKEYTSEMREKVETVNKERKRAWEAIEELQKLARAPLTEWENRDKVRVAANEGEIAKVLALGVFSGEASSAAIQRRIDSLANWHNYDWQEFETRAKAAQESVSVILKARLAQVQKQEADNAELEKLRKEAEERKQKDRDAAIAAEAAQRAKDEAEKEAARQAAAKAAAAKEREDAIKRDKESAEAATLKAQQDTELAEREKQEALAREEAAKQKAKEDAERAEAARIEQEKKNEERRIAAEKEAAEREKAAAEAATKKERERIAAAEQAKAEETARREADKKHKSKINNEALNALAIVIKREIPLDEELNFDSAARAIVEAIARGEIPNVKISY